MKKKVIISCFLVILLCIFFVTVYISFNTTTLHEILIQNDFDITKVENFEIYQNNYDWSKNELSTKNITNIQNVLKYFENKGSIKLREHKPLFKESEFYFDYYNHTSLIYLKLSYKDKLLIMSFHNTDFGICDIIVYNDGEINKYNVYFKDFKNFLIDDYSN